MFHRVHVVAWVGAWSVACQPEPATLDPACAPLCNHLVEDCALSSFPSVSSCVDGCAASDQSGGDIQTQWTCVQLAGCDLFEIVECEHDFGPR